MGKETITVDWDSLEDVTKVFRKSKTRFFQLKRESGDGISKKVRKRAIFDACCTIMNTDISSLYADRILDQQPKYFVYAHTDPLRKIAVGFAGITTFATTLGMQHFPFYIGKGTGERHLGFNRSETHRKMIQKIEAIGKEPIAVVLRRGLTESEALQMESKLIDIFGLIPQSGFLANLDEGVQPQERRKFYMESYLALRGINRAMTAGV